MVFLRALLFPFAILYDLVTRFRNYLYDTGRKKSFRFQVMMVGVGNLNVGGSGKTPMIEYLVERLSPYRRIATLSRGYGRDTKGLRFASPSDSAETIGDEPYQFYRKWGNTITVTVAEDRAFAIPNLRQHFRDVDLILLDDSFQHRSVDPQLSILLTDFASPFYNDFVLPAGNLRESRRGARRSHAVVVTKCPMDLGREKQTDIEKSIHHYAPTSRVFFTGIQYADPIGFDLGTPASSEIVLVTGIANSHPFVKHVESQYNVIRHFRFRDHHRFMPDELTEIQEYCKGLNKPISIFTTEKDMVKLIDPRLSEHLNFASVPWFYVPITVVFLKNGSDFDGLVLQSIQSVKQGI